MIATGFSVLLGFIIFLAFSSYDQSRSGAEAEALVVARRPTTAQFFPAAYVGQLTGELVCYGRSVVHGEWERMEAGSQGDAINPWAVALFQTVKGVEPKSASEQSAYDKWLDQTSDREEGSPGSRPRRGGRVAGAALDRALLPSRRSSSCTCSSSPIAGSGR